MLGKVEGGNPMLKIDYCGGWIVVDTEKQQMVAGGFRSYEEVVRARRKLWREWKERRKVKGGKG